MFIKLTRANDNMKVWINVNYILEVRQDPEGGGALIDECGYSVGVKETANQVMEMICGSGFQKYDCRIIAE